MSVELDESGGGSRGRALGTGEGAEQLERILRSTVTSGHVGALSLDPKYFVFEAAPREWCFHVQTDIFPIDRVPNSFGLFLPRLPSCLFVAGRLCPEHPLDSVSPPPPPYAPQKSSYHYSNHFIIGLPLSVTSSSSLFFASLSTDYTIYRTNHTSFVLSSLVILLVRLSGLVPDPLLPIFHPFPSGGFSSKLLLTTICIYDGSSSPHEFYKLNR